jgi:hypothetical protein
MKLAPQDKPMALRGKNKTGLMSYIYRADAIYIIQHQCICYCGDLHHRAATFGSPFLLPPDCGKAVVFLSHCGEHRDSG